MESRPVAALCRAASSAADGPPPAPAGPSKWRLPDWAKRPDNREVTLEVYTDGARTRAIDLRALAGLVVGRQGDIVDLLVDDASVSRQHAAIVNSATGTFLLDLKSAQGTFVSDDCLDPVPRLGREVPSAKPVQLEEAQTIRLGACGVVLKVTGVKAAAPDSREPEESYQVPAWCTLPNCSVTLVGGPKDKQIRKDLSGARGVVLGRSEGRSDITVPDGSVSRQHAAIVHDEDTTFVVDLGSAHGTFLDSARLETGVYTKINGEAKLAFGSATFGYTLAVGAPRAASGQAAKRPRQK